MIFTEKKAKSKLCPINPGMDYCSGDYCMAWVWVKWKKVDGDKEFWGYTEECKVKPYKGKCGMVKYDC